MNNIMPLYQSMLNDLIHKIESGQLPDNSKLPSEQQLGSIYKVSRITVRRALSELENRNYIYKKQGQGSFVSGNNNYDLKIRFWDVNKKIRKMDAVPTVKLLKFELNIDGSEKRIRKELNIDTNEYLYIITFMYYANDDPVFLDRIFLPFSKFPMIHKSEVTNNENLIPYLVKKYEVRPEFIRKTSPGLVTKNSRKLFNLNVGDPLVNIQNKGIFNGQIIYYSQSTVVRDLIMFIV